MEMSAIIKSAADADFRPGRQTERADAPRDDSVPPKSRVRPADASRAAGRVIADQLAKRSVANTRAGLRLRVDEKTHLVVVQVLNSDSQVIDQIPPEERLRISARFRDLVGLIFDQKG
jgi:uncharacterized FlaG/YvyC family protein